MTPRAAADAAGDNPLLGVLLMVAFCVLIPFGDAGAKLLGATVPLVQLMTFRMGVQALILVPLVGLTGRTLRMQLGLFAIVVLRTILFVLAMAAMFTALRFMPLADAVAIAFVLPFVLLLLGAVFLGEEVGVRRISACAVGFVGTLLVVQPSFVEVGAPALLPLLVAILLAVYMLISRRIVRRCDPVILQAWAGIVSTPLLAVLLVASWSHSGPIFGVIAPNAYETSLLVGIGVVGTAAHLLMTWSLRFAPSATVAPVQYLEMPFATAVGWMIFGELPNGLATLGIVLIIASGLYILWRERRLAVPEPPKT